MTFGHAAAARVRLDCLVQAVRPPSRARSRGAGAAVWVSTMSAIPNKSDHQATLKINFF
jgi:hypothetical protein